MEKIRLYVNDTKTEAKILADKIRAELQSQGYVVECDNPDIVIGFGGDGTLLHFLREENYNVTAKYIGINCGTLGFLQDFNVVDVESFVKNISKYVEQRLHFITLEVDTGNEVLSFSALNEFTVLEGFDKTFRTRLEIQGEFLENFVGTGMIFATTTGSTAMNLSAGGAIVYPDIEMIQVTPREAISNSKIHCLNKSICIPKEYDIVLSPLKDNSIKIFSDGAIVFNGEYVSLRLIYSKKYMVKLRAKEDNFIKTIREKLI